MTSLLSVPRRLLAAVPRAWAADRVIRIAVIGAALTLTILLVASARVSAPTFSMSNNQSNQNYDGARNKFQRNAMTCAVVIKRMIPMTIGSTTGNQVTLFSRLSPRRYPSSQ